MRATNCLLSSAALVLLDCGTEVQKTTAAVVQEGATECDPDDLAWYRPDPLACCKNGTDQWFITGAGARLNHRTRGIACTTDGVTPCTGGPTCIFGPCGGTGGTNYNPPAHVFIPFSDPTVCGRQATGLPGFPEEWTGAQESYPGFVPTCRFNDCSPNGLPVFTIAVTGVTNGATGTVESIPDGLHLTGAGTATFSFSENDVNFIAEPVGAHARARFTNGCVATGAYGTKAYCKNLTRVILQAPASGPHPITVTYECEPGFTCQN